jgi:hypothetical protein
VARADWTYEVAPAGADSAGLEGYVVEASSGDAVGTVRAVLRRADEVYLAVTAGSAAGRETRAVRWSDVERVDHESLTIRLAVPTDAFEQAPELDPGKAVEGAGADAVRLTDLPAELRPSDSPAAPGPTDRPPYLAALGLGLAGVFALLVLVIAATVVDFDWEFVLFAIPAALFALAALAGWRLLRRPYE